jgi:capsular exopolysaccharide synthesis family protein
MLSVSGGQAEGIPSLAQMSVLVQVGEVPKLAAEKLGIPPSAVVDGIGAFPDDTSGALNVVVGDTSEQGAVERAHALAEALIESVNATAEAQYDSQVAAAQDRVDAIEAQVRATNPLDPSSESLQASLNDARSALEEARGNGSPVTDLQILDQPSVSTISSTSKRERILIAGVVGLIIGLALALILSRFDTRIHSRETAEDAFGLPVISEIPHARRSLRGAAGAVVVNRQDSPLAEAYRGLRSALLLSTRARADEPTPGDRVRPWSGVAGDRARGKSRVGRRVNDGGARAIMVMSAGMSEGKSTCVSNLALAYAESDATVLIISCDLRRPAIEKYLGVEGEHLGVSDVLRGEVEVEEVVVKTETPNVSMLTAGTPVHNPAGLLAHGERLLGPARGLADVVIVDTPPVLATDDMSQLIPLVDDVVLVCRSGSTTEEAARRTSERLLRLGAKIDGVVLIGGRTAPTVRGYYRSYVPDQARAGRRRGFRGSSPATVVTDEAPGAAVEVHAPVEQSDTSRLAGPGALNGESLGAESPVKE